MVWYGMVWWYRGMVQIHTIPVWWYHHWYHTYVSYHDMLPMTMIFLCTVKKIHNRLRTWVQKINYPTQCHYPIIVRMHRHPLAAVVDAGPAIELRPTAEGALPHRGLVWIRLPPPLLLLAGQR